ncbi:non-ribosomal peptide synthetase, partial [Vibrio azureus]
MDLEKKRALLKKMMAEKAAKKAVMPQLIKQHIQHDEPVPLSFAQQRLWSVDQMQNGSVEYNMPIILRMKGHLNTFALTQALNTIVQRHHILRTTYRIKDGQPVQHVKDEVMFELPVYELLSDDVKDSKTRQTVMRERLDFLLSQPFDLSSDIMMRGELLRLGAEEHLLVIIMHHIASDGWSQGIWADELSKLYDGYCEGEEAPLLPLSIQYKDYALWQRDNLQGEALRQLTNYWQQTLKGLPTLHNLPTDFPRPAEQSFRGQQIDRSFSKSGLAALYTLAKAHDSTLFMVLNAALSCFLARYSGETDIVIGTPIANRDHSETQGLIGCFLNNLVLRTDMSESLSFTELLQMSRKNILSAFEHQQMPFDLLVETLQPERSLSHQPLFQIMLVLQNNDDASLRLNGIDTEIEVFKDDYAKFDLTLEVTESEQGLTLNWVFAKDLFTPQSVERLADSFNVLLEGIVAQPNQKVQTLPLLTSNQQDGIVNQFNRSEVPLARPHCIHQYFEQQAKQRPNELAIVVEETAQYTSLVAEKMPDEKMSLTYGELNNKANQLAHHLIQLGVKPDTLVGLSVSRSVDMLIGMLGILKAGGAYVAIDPTNPTERVQYMLNDSGIQFLVTEKETARLAGDITSISLNAPEIGAKLSQYTTDNPVLAQELTAKNLAYVIYTSGSTGQPKGVLLEHLGAVNLLQSLDSEFAINENSRVLQFAALGFDAATWEWMMALTQGACLYICSDNTRVNPDKLSDFLLEHKVTHALIPPSLLAHLDMEREYAFQVLIVGGEACDQALAWQWAERFPLYNAYGPSECTVCATISRVQPHQTLNIGSALDNLSIYVLDDEQQIVPIGVEGELHIAGLGLARGYLNQVELTKEKFFDLSLPSGSDLSKFSNPEAKRVYKTGDRVRWLPSGELVFVGRSDDQIKIRGFRIELGEIENALSRHQSVKDALVLAQSAKGSKEKQLVAWVVAEKDAESFLISEQELIEQAKLSLPHYMIPSVFCLMEALPLTVNGKVDKKALPQPDLCSSNVYQAPKTETEHKLASLWSTLLATEQVGRQSNFFSLGGHSLLATKLITEIKQAWEVDLSIRSIFETQTLEDQADLIDRESHVDCRANRRQIIANPNIDKAPLSFSQQRLWFLDRMHPGGSEYNMPAALKLTGKLDIAALESALATVVQRHEVLNTVYVESTHAQVSTKTQAQRTESSVVKGRVLKLQQKDLTHLTVEDKSEEIHRLVTEEASKSFDLSQDMMLRTQLLTLDKENFVLLITMHHIASDGWSMNLLINELSTLYGAFSRQKAAPLPPLPIQYRDYALWQRDWLKGDTLEQHLTYWRKQLSSLPLVHSLPVDFVRPAVQKFQGNQIKQQIDVATTSKLKQLAENNNATLFMAIHTLFAALLSRYSGESDIVMGSPIANRDQLEVKDLIGFFANTLVLRLDTAGNPSFEQLLSHSKETLLQAWEHQHVPFEILVDDLQPERSLSYNPLFQIMLSLNDTNVNSLKFGDVALSPIEQPNHTAQFDLTLDMSETEHGLALAWEYNTELFLPETISRMSQCLQRLIGAVIESPSAPLNAIEILAEVDQQKLNAWSNTAFLDAEVLSVEEQFDLQVKRTPDATALVWNTKRLSYQALQHRADKLAHRLIEQGVQQGDLVGLCLPRGVDLIVSILAIFKAGAAYLPLDPAYPKARLEHMLNDSQADFIITDTEQLGLLPPVRVPYMLLDTPETIAQLEEHHIEFTCLPSNHSAPAYVIYTSGSTGVPKGVKVSRKAAANHIATINDHFKLTSQDRCILSASVNFDAAFEQIFLPLTLGCELHIVSLQEMEVSKFDRYLTQNAISVADLPLAYLSQYLTYLNSQKTLEAKQLTSLELLVVGGEAIPKATVESCFDVNLCRRFINAYGPTEASVTSTAFEITADNLASLTTMLIGQACGPRQLYVVNPLMQRVPVGAVGELLIGGDCLADGYLHRDTLTEERFIDDHLSQKPGAKLYRTGDLVRYHQDGQLEFVGRIDDQVKLRGFRIELGEIETVLMQHEAVIQAVVMIKKTEQGIDQLIAYLVTKLGLESELQHNLSEYLSKTLPDHMIPAIFMSLNELPLTAAGKINRQALLDIKLTLLNSDEPPKSETEQRLASIWCQLLSCQSVCRDSHFFALGGHSLLAVGLISQVRDAWQVELSLKAIFELKTLKGIASQIDNQLARSGSKDFMDLHVMPLNKAPQDALLPVSFAQQRLWFIAQLEPNGYEYNMPEAFYVNGRLEVAAFTRALNSVVERHQILRTVYRVKDQNVYQSVLQDFDSVLELIDISEYSHTEQQVMLENLVEQEAITPFNLSKDLMLRAKLVKLKKEGVETEGPHNAFLITQHHIASDGWSTSVLISELSSAYHRFLTTEPTPLLPLEYQYSDYAYSQRAWLEGERLERHLDYWLQQLADLPPVHHLPLDKARPSIQSFQGAELAQTLSPELSRLILTLAQHNEASLFMVLKAAFSLLLSRYSGETDIVIGTPVANREQVELEPIIGFFVNTLVMRTQVDHQQSFTQLLAQCRDNTLAGLQHQQAPFETLVERLQPERSLSYNPLFQIMLSVENNRQSDFNLDGLEFESIEQEYSTSQFDLSLNVVESEQGIQLHWEYSTDLFEHSSMTRMAEHFDQLLHQIVHRPNDKMSDISILSSDERT